VCGGPAIGDQPADARATHAGAIDEKGYAGLPGVKIAVTARKDRAAFALMGPAIVVPLPVIPLPGSLIDPPKREPPVWIDVAIDPEGEGFSFAPGEVRLRRP
jgi:hypothetical protein